MGWLPPDFTSPQPGAWWPLAWFIHDNRDKLPYSEMQYFHQNAAFNLTWREKEPRHEIRATTGCADARDGGGCSPQILTKPGLDSHEGDHSEHYRGLPGIQPASSSGTGERA